LAAVIDRLNWPLSSREGWWMGGKSESVNVIEMATSMSKSSPSST